MKLRIVYLTFSLAFLAFLSLSNSEGRASSQNWGNTGAPGDQTLGNGTARTCQNCHATGDIQVTLDLEILDADSNRVTAYTPNEIYTTKVTINHANGPVPNGYGFQIVSLFDKDDSDVNGWTESGHSDNVQIAVASNTNRVYAEQANTSDTNEFLVQWKAPEVGNGAISFYTCGIGVNRNGTSNGDGAATPQKLTLMENSLSSIQELSAIGIDFNMAPNPVTDEFSLKIESKRNKQIDIQVLTTNGQILYKNHKILVQGMNNLSIPTNDFATGVYLVQISTEGAISTKKLIKY